MTTTSAGQSLQEIQSHAVRSHLTLSRDEKARVLEMIATTADDKTTRRFLLIIIRFEDGEVVVVDDMEAFIKGFDKVVYHDTRRDIEKDSFSIATLDRGENAYQEYTKLTEFLDTRHQGWFLTVQEGVATFKKSTRLLRRIAHAFESYDKRFAEYRVVWDLRKTNEIFQEAKLEHERRLLFEDRLAKAHRHHRRRKSYKSEDTRADASSDVFTRFDAAKSSHSSSSSSREEVEIVSSAKEVSEDVKARRALRSTDSSSSLTVVSPTKITIHRHKTVRRQPSTGSGSVSPDLTKKPHK